MKFPASYGYDVGHILVAGRQIRQPLSSGVIARGSNASRGKDMEPRKAARANHE